MVENSISEHKEVTSIDAAEAIRPTWVKPILKDEMSELQRTAELIPEFTLDEFVKAFNNAELVELNEEEWGAIDGPDNLFHQPNLTIEQVHAHLAGKRNSEVIEQGIKNGSSIPAPVVILGLWDNPYLIGGNSRLLTCKALGIRPMVLGLRLKKVDT